MGFGLSERYLKEYRKEERPMIWGEESVNRQSGERDEEGRYVDEGGERSRRGGGEALEGVLVTHFYSWQVNEYINEYLTCRREVQCSRRVSWYVGSVKILTVR